MGTANLTITFLNCTLLSSRASFPNYIQTLQNETSSGRDGPLNLTLLELCKPEICNALWGIGNADISGIGMIIGYLFESFLGFTFGLGLEVMRRTMSSPTAVETKPRAERYRAVLLRGCTVFFDCGIYFAASIQIACVVVLVRKDFGISADGLGGLTVQITWIVALLSLLPLLYPLVLLKDSTAAASEKELEKAESSRSRHYYRFCLLSLCWVLFLYTFISRMIADFAPSQVGQGAGPGGTTIINTTDWDTLNGLCLAGVQTLTESETMVIEAFGTAGSIILSLFILCPYLWVFMQGLGSNFIRRIEQKIARWCSKRGVKDPRPTAILILVPILTAPEIWGVFRIRSTQQTLTNAMGVEYTDNQWTFGQVVAVVIFAPVLTEVFYLSVHRRA